MNRIPWLLIVVLFLLSTAGFGCKKEENSSPRLSTPFAGVGDDVAREQAGDKVANQAKEVRGEAEKQVIERKIIVTANVQLVATDFDKAEQELDRLIQANKGIVAQSEVAGAAGGSRKGLWKVRISPAKFKEFCDAVKKLGDLIRYTSDANDVTEEYFDLAVRIKNKESEAADVRMLHDKGSGRIEDVLVLKRELQRVTEELERLKGRKRVLDNLTELTTVTIQLQERGTYLPPAAPDSPAFDSTIGRTWSGSIDVLVVVGKGIVLVAVALAPWLPVLAVIIVPTWWIWRRKKHVAVVVATIGEPVPSPKAP
jgi:hypothetical protein